MNFMHLAIIAENSARLLHVKLYKILPSVCHITDGIITGGSSLEHINENLDAFDDGPLDAGKITSVS